MKISKEINIVKAFVKTINEGNFAEMAALMSEDYTFTNSAGQTDSGRERMINGWQEYFKMFPDFTIKIDDFLQKGNLIAAFGTTSATYNGKRGLVPENRVGGPAAWKATIENDRIRTWQVYCDWTQDMKTIEEDKKFNTGK